MRKFRILLAAAALTMLGACTTMTGQQYGAAGAAGGAIIGGVTHGLGGALVGGAAGALAGGLIGDSVENSQRGSYAPPAYIHQRPSCYMVRERLVDAYGRPMFDYYGRPLYQDVCRRY